jgi:hypothetical protein
MLSPTSVARDILLENDDYSFPRLTSHEKKMILEWSKMSDDIEEDCGLNLNLNSLMKAVFMVFSEVWNENREYKFPDALKKMKFTEMNGDVLNNPLCNILILSMVLKMCKREGDAEGLENCRVNLKKSWNEFLVWFKLTDDE